MNRLLLLLVLMSSSWVASAQGVGLPSKRGGLGFGNLTRFSGIRFNAVDKNTERISGLNVTVWQAKDESLQTGSVNGIWLGLPLAMGSESINGVALGILGAGAKQNISGFSFGGLGVGSGGNIRGFSVGGLGVGSGKSIKGISIGGLGVGSGEDVSGISVGGLGVGAGGNIRGLSIGLIGVGSGKTMSGLSVAGIGLGAGEEIKGIAVAGFAIGSQKVTALAIAPCVGGSSVKGFIIAPLYMVVGDKDDVYYDRDSTSAPIDVEALMKGFSVSAFNNVRGHQAGVTVGLINKTASIRGFQLGLINVVEDNPKGLRVLPIFNTRFGKKKGG